MFDDGALLGAHKRLEIEISRVSFNDRASRVQLRQLPPDVVCDVVVRFVVRIVDEVFDRHTIVSSVVSYAC